MIRITKKGALHHLGFHGIKYLLGEFRGCGDGEDFILHKCHLVQTR